MSISERIIDWLKKPYSDEMSVTGWFLFLGFVAFVSIFWARGVKALLEQVKG